jgi:hypothetical protein
VKAPVHRRKVQEVPMPLGFLVRRLHFLFSGAAAQTVAL